MFKKCLLLGSMLALYMQAMEQIKQVIHLHTCKDDLDISINSRRTIGDLKKIIQEREGIDPTLQTIFPIWREWLIFKKNGPILSDDQELTNAINKFNTNDFELVFILAREYVTAEK